MLTTLQPRGALGAKISCGAMFRGCAACLANRMTSHRQHIFSQKTISGGAWTEKWTILSPCTSWNHRPVHAVEVLKSSENTRRSQSVVATSLASMFRSHTWSEVTSTTLGSTLWWARLNLWKFTYLRMASSDSPQCPIQQVRALWSRDLCTWQTTQSIKRRIPTKKIMQLQLTGPQKLKRPRSNQNYRLPSWGRSMSAKALTMMEFSRRSKMWLSKLWWRSKLQSSPQWVAPNTSTRASSSTALMS